ncbi:MAG: acyl-ACP thioesterase domain-containing protein [Sediminicola sp.]
MGAFEMTVTVTADDLDDLDHVNNVRYVQWIQDVSKAHWESKAPQELKENMIWVVINHNITYSSSAKLNDLIFIRTHIEKTRGAISVRIVEMFLSETGQALVTAKTEWCLLNATTLKPVRVPKDIQHIFTS